MTTEKASKTQKSDKPAPGGVSFRCPRCGRERPIEEMAVVARFFPLLVLCHDCDTKVR